MTTHSAVERVRNLRTSRRIYIEQQKRKFSQNTDFMWFYLCCSIHRQTWKIGQFIAKNSTPKPCNTPLTELRYTRAKHRPNVRSMKGYYMLQAKFGIEIECIGITKQRAAEVTAGYGSLSMMAAFVWNIVMRGQLRQWNWSIPSPPIGRISRRCNCWSGHYAERADSRVQASEYSRCFSS